MREGKRSAEKLAGTTMGMPLSKGSVFVARYGEVYQLIESVSSAKFEGFALRKNRLSLQHCFSLIIRTDLRRRNILQYVVLMLSNY